MLIIWTMLQNSGYRGGSSAWHSRRAPLYFEGPAPRACMRPLKSKGRILRAIIIFNASEMWFNYRMPTMLHFVG